MSLVNVPYDSGRAGFDDSVLEEFFRGKRVEAAREYFYVVDGRPHFSCWVEWCGTASSAPRGTKSAGARPRGGPRGPGGAAGAEGAAGEVGARGPERSAQDDELDVALSESQQRTYEALRAWRLERSREMGVPAYRVLTNRVLTRIARIRPTSVESLAQIPGVGVATREGFGAEIVALLETQG